MQPIKAKNVPLLCTTAIFFNLLLINITKAQGYAGFPADLGGIVSSILNTIFGVAGAIFVIMIIVGGLQYLTSAGNEDAASKAKKLMFNAIIGIVIVVGAWAISGFILNAIGGVAIWPY